MKGGVPWTCPICASSTRIWTSVVPTDARLWCLECTAKEGHLVARCEGDGEGTARSMLRTRRDDPPRPARHGIDSRKRRYLSSFRGFDLQVEFDALLRTDTARAKIPQVFGRPVLHVVRRYDEPRGVIGRARLVPPTVFVYVWPECPKEEALATLLHEVAHLASRGGPIHGDEWRANYVELAREHFPGIEIGAAKGRAYGHLDFEVAAGIRQWILKHLGPEFRVR